MIRTTGPFGAKIYFLGHWPDESDLPTMKPFSGQDGTLLKRILKQAGIAPHACLFSNCYTEFPINGIKAFATKAKMRDVTPLYLEMREQVLQDIRKYNPTVVVTLGQLALHMLTGEFSVKAHRGYITESNLVEGLKVLPTHHPAGINKDWLLAFPVLMDIRKAVRHIKTPFAKLKDDNFYIVNPSKDEFIDYIETLIVSNVRKNVAFDIETRMPGPHITWIGFAASTNVAISLKLMNGTYPAFNSDDELEIWQVIARLFATDKTFIAHNGQYDVSILTKNHNITPKVSEDTMLAGHACWPQLPKSLGFMSSICLDVAAWKHTASDNVGLYNAKDCTNTLGIFKFMQKELEKSKSTDIYKHEVAQIPVAVMLGLQGIRIDVAIQGRLREEAELEMTSVRGELDELTKQPDLNYNSVPQVAKLLYEDFGFPTQYRRRKSILEKKTVTTNAKALDVIIRKTSHALPTLIKAHRRLAERLNVHLKPVPNQETDCVYTSYNICGKDTTKIDDPSQSMGRWSSSKTITWDLEYNAGNLQAIPKPVRKMYIPSDGNVIVQGDLKQAEAVAVAYFTNDERSKRVFHDGGDVHRMNAGLFYGIKPEDVSMEKGSCGMPGKDFSQRDIGKRLKHAINYGGGSGVVAGALNIAPSIAKQMYEKTLQVNPYINLYHERIKRKLTKDLTLTTPPPFNRRRRFLERWGDDLFRSAYAYLPQSLIGDILNKAIVTFYNLYGGKYAILLQLHDAIYVECAKDEATVLDVMAKLRECMVMPIVINGDTMIIDVDFSVSTSWGGMASCESVNGQLILEGEKYSYDRLIELCK